MKRLHVRGGGVVTCEGVRTAPLTILIDGGHVAALDDATAADADEVVELNGGWLIPGLIDVQVNGGGGLLFNDAPDAATVAVIADAHVRLGVTGVMPTLISDSLVTIAAGLDAVDAAIAAGCDAVLGIHVEGPFISPGVRGIHALEHIRRLDAEAVATLCQPRRGKVMVTVAPECCEPGQIEAMAAAGVAVSLGHSAATASQAHDALAAGARGFTHLYNAMSPLHHREPGMVGVALVDPGSWCGLIVDGVHVDPLALRLALRMKGPDRLMLVSDAMPIVGTDRREFALNGRRIVASGGGLRDETGVLAGADLDLARALRNAVTMMEVDVDAAVRMAATSPAAFLGLEGERGSIGIGRRADFVQLTPDLSVDRVWLAGKAQWRDG